jgi:hypothetical protein
VVYPPQKFIPDSREGHSLLCLDEGHLLLFGGLHDVTQERGGLHLYSFNENSWLVLDIGIEFAITKEPKEESYSTLGNSEPPSGSKVYKD